MGNIKFEFERPTGPTEAMEQLAGLLPDVEFSFNPDYGGELKTFTKIVAGNKVYGNVCLRMGSHDVDAANIYLYVSVATPLNADKIAAVRTVLESHLSAITQELSALLAAGEAEDSA